MKVEQEARYYSNVKVKKRLEAFYKAKKQIPLKEVDVKVVFEFDPTKKIKNLLLKEESQGFGSPGLSTLITNMSTSDRAWVEFGIDSFREVWKTSLMEFLKVVPKCSLLMRQLLSNETMHCLETQCKASKNTYVHTDTTGEEFLPKRSKPYLPTTCIGERFDDIFTGDYRNVEDKMKKHYLSHFYENVRSSFTIPHVDMVGEEEVWMTTDPIVLELPSLGYNLKLISFCIHREERKMIKCFMTTACKSNEFTETDEKFERTVIENRYRETRYLYVDLTQCHVKINSSDLCCFLHFLKRPMEKRRVMHPKKDGEGKEEEEDEEEEKEFTSMNYVVATYIADYLGFSIFPRGWQKITL